MSGRDGTQALESIFGEISRILVQRLARWRAPDHAPFATEVVCIDESTLDQMVTFRQGNTQHRYITNVHNPRTFPMSAMAKVYAQRWDIELAFKMLKRYLKLHLIWSAKKVVIQQQIWATLIVAQVLQGLRLEIAYKAGVDPNEVSMPLLVEYAPVYAHDGENPVEAFVQHGRELRFIRPSRRNRISTPELPQEEFLPLPQTWN